MARSPCWEVLRCCIRWMQAGLTRSLTWWCQVMASTLGVFLITTTNSGVANVASPQCFLRILKRNKSETFQVAASTAMIVPDPWNWQLDWTNVKTMTVQHEASAFADFTAGQKGLTLTLYHECPWCNHGTTNASTMKPWTWNDSTWVDYTHVRLSHKVESN